MRSEAGKLVYPARLWRAPTLSLIIFGILGAVAQF